ncbi:MAG TPA: hypothetical protein VD816_04550 [Ohtaekwangia sp.]|nr:hypothetical protein [Ohtaekwangia sp.]
MKSTRQILKLSGTLLFCAFFLSFCSDPETDPASKADPLTVEGLNTLSEHLRLQGATKKEGQAPQGPAGASSLSISFRDTLYLMKDVQVPVKFLHDASANVAGVYVQVHGSPDASGNVTSATHFYDVPEFEETNESDSVSVILVEFDLGDFELPVSIPVTLIPYDDNLQALDEIEEIIKVEESFEDFDASAPCSFTSPPVEGWWQWAYSLQRENGEITFFSSPDVAYGGQTINGCCTNGFSGYTANCLPENVESLFFPTYYQIAGETFIFKADGTFERITLEKHSDPAPEVSDFCGVAYGVVETSLEFVTYEGNWTVNATSNYLQLQTTSSTGSGYGNPGGVLRHNCHGLVMLMGNGEGGGGAPLEKFYFRMRPEDYEWYPVNE